MGSDELARDVVKLRDLGGGRSETCRATKCLPRCAAFLPDPELSVAAVAWRRPGRRISANRRMLRSGFLRQASRQPRSLQSTFTICRADPPGGFPGDLQDERSEAARLQCGEPTVELGRKIQVGLLVGDGRRTIHPRHVRLFACEVFARIRLRKRRAESPAPCPRFFQGGVEFVQTRDQFSMIVINGRWPVSRAGVQGIMRASSAQKKENLRLPAGPPFAR